MSARIAAPRARWRGRAASRSRCRRSPAAPSIVRIPADPGAVRSAGCSEQQEAGTAARVEADGHAAASTGRSASARPRPGFAPAVTPDAIYAAASDGTLVRVDPATGRTVWRISAGKRLSAGAGADATSSSSAPTRATCSRSTPTASRSGRRKVSSEVDRAAARSPKASSSCSSGDGRVYGLVRRRRQDEVGQPAHTIRRSPCATTRAASSTPRRPVHRHRRRTPAGARPRDRHRRLGRAPSPLRRARPSSSASPTSLACRCVEEQQVCAVAYQGRVACFDIMRGTLNWSRDVSSLDGIAADGTLHLRHRRQGRGARARQDAPARRCGSRTSSRSAGSAVRRWSATTSAVVDVEGYVHLLAPANGAYVGRLATDGTRARPRQPAAVRAADAARGSRRARHRCYAVATRDASARDADVAMLPTLALVGRPNVGKSTLFNRLTQIARRARRRLPGPDARPPLRPRARSATGRISSSTPAASSRSRRPASCTRWRRQTRQAIAEADVVVFIVDGATGLTPQDRNIADLLRRSGRPGRARRQQGGRPAAGARRGEFHELGAGRAASRSRPRTARTCATWSRCALVARAARARRRGRKRTPTTGRRSAIKVAIVGRPNVGKSTLVNALLGEERVIAFDEPGTTRDAIYLDFERDGRRYTLIDTAGVRRRGKVFEAIEKFSVIKTMQAIEDAQRRRAAARRRARRSPSRTRTSPGTSSRPGARSSSAINKWDARRPGRSATQVKRDLDRKLAFLAFAQHHFISAREGRGIGRAAAVGRRGLRRRDGRSCRRRG